MHRSLALVLGAFSVPAPALVPAPAAPPCSGPEYRTLDFWVGEWTAEWDNGDGTKGTGTNRITRDEHGQCAIVEHYHSDDGSLDGFSISTYRPGSKRWRQTWVDAQGGYFDLIGGPVEGSDHRFSLETVRISETQPYQRMIFQDVQPDGFTWRWQLRAKAEDAWKDSWVIKYRRKASTGAAKS